MQTVILKEDVLAFMRHRTPICSRKQLDEVLRYSLDMSFAIKFYCVPVSDINAGSDAYFTGRNI